MTNEADKSKETGEGGCACPFCDAPVDKISPLCKACGVTVNHCSSCGKPLPKDKKDCPDCNG